MRNEEILHGVSQERDNLHRVKRRKVNWIGYIWRGNWLLIHVIGGKIDGRIEVTGRQGKRRSQLLDELNALTPNDPYTCRTAPLTSKRCILYIYSTNTGTEYFKHGI